MKVFFIGFFFEFVNFKFEEYYVKWLLGFLSCVFVFYKFVVIVLICDMVCKVFNLFVFVKFCVVDVVYKFFGVDNWVFFDGKVYVDFCKGFNGFFICCVFEIYFFGQEEVYNCYFKFFVDIFKVVNFKLVFWMIQFCEIIMVVFCCIFVGYYFGDEVVKKIVDDYYFIIEVFEFVNFFIIIFFIKIWYGKKVVDMVFVEFVCCVVKFKIWMVVGGEFNCIMDVWVVEMIVFKKWCDVEEVGNIEGFIKLIYVFCDFIDYEIV